jgi:tetratricopeptide (TPR) repeat protein
MKKALSIFFLLLSLLAFKNIAYAQQEIDACFNFKDTGDYKRAIKAGKLAIKKYPKDLGGYDCLAGVYRAMGKFNFAYETMKKAEKIARNKEYLNLTHVYIEIADILRDMDKLDDALTYYNKTLNLARDLKDSLTQAFILRNIADVYARKGELDKALNYYNEALNLETFESGKADICNSIADVYDKKGDHQKSAEYRQKAIRYIQQDMGGGYDVFAMIKIGNTYKRMRDYKNAEKYILEAFEYAKKYEDEEGEAYSYIALGDLYKDMGDKKRAKEYYQRAYKVLKSIGQDYYAQDVLNEIRKLDKSK